MSKNSVEPKSLPQTSSLVRLTAYDLADEPGQYSGHDSGDSERTASLTTDASTKRQVVDEQLTSLATLWRLNIAMTSPSSNQAIRAALIIRRLERQETSEARRIWRYKTGMTSILMFGSISASRKPRPRYKGNIGDYGRCSFWDASTLTR